MKEDIIDQYITILNEDEDVIRNEREIEISSVDPETFNVRTRKTTVFVLNLAKAIQEKMKEFEPSDIVFSDDKVLIGFCNPRRSKRMPGESFKSVVRVTIENIDR